MYKSVFPADESVGQYSYLYFVELILLTINLYFTILVSVKANIKVNMCEIKESFKVFYVI